MSLNVLIVEDEPLIASDIHFTVTEVGYTVIGIAHTSLKAMDMINTRKPDIVLLDISIKGEQNGIEIGSQLKNKYKIPFIYVTSFADKNTLQLAKETLPYGYIVKPFKDKDIPTAIEMAMFRFHAEQSTKFPDIKTINKHIHQEITNREYEVAQKIWEGKNNNEISNELFLSINTIKTHTKNLFNKLGVRSRNETIAFLRKLS